MHDAILTALPVEWQSTPSKRIDSPQSIHSVIQGDSDKGDDLKGHDFTGY
jgi:hypothetical protein